MLLRAASPLFLAAALLGLASGCGGTTSPGLDDQTADAAVDGAATDASGSADAACVVATVGAACSAASAACQPADPCCAGYLWTCDPSTHVWEKAGLGCACVGPGDAGGSDADASRAEDAGPFACGGLTCPGDAYCTDTPPGINFADGGRPPDYFACTKIPASCAATPTCACIEASLPSGDACSTRSPAVTCVDQGAGRVTLHCQGI